MQVKINQDEFIRFAKELAQAEKELEELKEDKKEMSSDFKSRQDSLEKRIKRVRDIVISGYEDKQDTLFNQVLALPQADTENIIDANIITGDTSEEEEL